MLAELKAVYMLAQDYWLLLLLISCLLLKNTFKGWVDSRLAIEVSRSTETLKANFAVQLEGLKLAYSTELEEAKLRIEIRKAVALDMARQRLEYLQTLERKIGVAGRSVRVFLLTPQAERTGQYALPAQMDALKAASDAVSEKQLLLALDTVQNLHTLILEVTNLAIEHERYGQHRQDGDAVLDKLDRVMLQAKSDIRALLNEVAENVASSSASSPLVSKLE